MNLKYPLEQVNAVILAGGEGSRMNYRNKALMPFRGKPLFEHVLARIKPQVSTVIIVANADVERFQSSHTTVISDNRSFGQGIKRAGPLAGIEAALLACRTEFLVSVPCDTPFLPDNLVQKLYDDVYKSKADLSVACDGKYRHSVFCFMKRSVVNSLQQFLNSGGRKINIWFEQL